LGTAGIEQTFEKAAKNWQDETTAVDYELCERTPTLTLSSFIFCNIHTQLDIIRNK